MQYLCPSARNFIFEFCSAKSMHASPSLTESPVNIVVEYFELISSNVFVFVSSHLCTSVKILRSLTRSNVDSGEFDTTYRSRSGSLDRVYSVFLAFGIKFAGGSSLSSFLNALSGANIFS